MTFIPTTGLIGVGSRSSQTSSPSRPARCCARRPSSSKPRPRYMKLLCSAFANRPEQGLVAGCCSSVFCRIVNHPDPCRIRRPRSSDYGNLAVVQRKPAACADDRSTQYEAFCRVYSTSMGASAETELAMVERHVYRGEIIIGRQVRLIERLTHLGLATEEARDLLNLFQSIQAEHLLHLAKLRRREPRPRLPGLGQGR
jgi:hypothetical protein